MLAFNLGIICVCVCVCVWCYVILYLVPFAPYLLLRAAVRTLTESCISCLPNCSLQVSMVHYYELIE